MSNPTSQTQSQDCWLYAGYINESGYGRISYCVKGKTIGQFVHRIFYEHFVGPIPEGLTIDHLCNVSRCINPAHLEPVTKELNSQRKYGVGKCKRGHDLTPDNVYIHITDEVTQRHERQCRTCVLERMKRAYRKSKEKLV